MATGDVKIRFYGNGYVAGCPQPQAGEELATRSVLKGGPTDSMEFGSALNLYKAMTDSLISTHGGLIGKLFTRLSLEGVDVKKEVMVNSDTANGAAMDIDIEGVAVLTLKDRDCDGKWDDVEIMTCEAFDSGGYGCNPEAVVPGEVIRENPLSNVARRDAMEMAIEKAFNSILESAKTESTE